MINDIKSDWKYEDREKNMNELKCEKNNYKRGYGVGVYG